MDQIDAVVKEHPVPLLQEPLVDECPVREGKVRERAAELVQLVDVRLDAHRFIQKQAFGIQSGLCRVAFPFLRRVDADQTDVAAVGENDRIAVDNAGYGKGLWLNKQDEYHGNTDQA